MSIVATVAHLKFSAIAELLLLLL